MARITRMTRKKQIQSDSLSAMSSPLLIHPQDFQNIKQCEIEAGCHWAKSWAGIIVVLTPQ
jgi:predicted RNA-binding Zn ribbon-like protein